MHARPTFARTCLFWSLPLLVLATILTQAVTPSAAADSPFVDVPVGYLFEVEITWLSGEGITKGCNPPANDRFCPDDLVTRGQMAAFLARAFDLSTEGNGNTFGDDDGSIFETDIARIAAAGITKGCNPPANDRFCPDDLVTRGQMAAFLARGLGRCPELSSIPEEECRALIAFYGATAGHNWRNDIGWLGTSDPCTWFGLACVDGHIAEVSLGVNGLAGPVPSDLGRLTSLTLLDLSHNDLIRPIPSELGQLTNLEILDLSHNQLYWLIPGELGRLTDLTHLDLSHNGFLLGPIPSELGQLINLTNLDLGYNELLDGPIPAELGQLTNLVELSLEGNDLSGQIPTELQQLTKLTDLNLSYNRLDGPIPVAIAQLASLVELNLQANHLSELIPTELGQLKALTGLRLDYNELTGPIPTELGQLINLGTLGLAYNSFAGQVPDSLTDLPLGQLSLAGQSGCLTASPALTPWLEAHDPSWNDGCD